MSFSTFPLSSVLLISAIFFSVFCFTVGLAGVPRKNQTEKDFADFDLFDDSSMPYSTFNFTYTHEQFQRLSQLTEFNTLHSLDQIKRVLAEVVARKRQSEPRMPIQMREFKLLRMKSVQEQRQLKKFLKRMESRGNVIKTPTPSGSSTPPATPFFTPTPLPPVRERNPFVFSRKSSSSSSDSPQQDNPFFNTSRQNSQTKSSNGVRGSPRSAARFQETPGPRQDSSKDFFPASSTPPRSSSSSSASSSSSSIFFSSVSSQGSDHALLHAPCKISSPSPQSAHHPSLNHSDRQTSPKVDNVRQSSSASPGSFRQSSSLSRDVSDEDEFHDAAEAFTRDGVPVTDPREAKMYYDGAKRRRMLLRRQSTISSLNSISLDSAQVKYLLVSSLTHSLIHSFIYSLTPSLTFSPIHSFSHLLTNAFTHLLAHAFSPHSVTHSSFTHSSLTH